MKILVETTGPFMLVNPETGCELAHNRPSVAISTNFLQSRIATGQVKVLSNPLMDSATDAEFHSYWKASDRKKNLAIESFLSAFLEPEVGLDLEPNEDQIPDEDPNRDPEPEPEPEPVASPKPVVKISQKKGHK